MGDGGGILVWLFFALHAFVLFAVIGVAVGLVRRASARGAYVLAAAAGVRLLLSCCSRAGVFAMTRMDGDPRPVSMALSCLELIAELVTVALIAFAFVTLSRAITNPEKPSPVG